MADGLPSYDELPGGRAWSVWGEGDVFGSLNLLTPERVLAGVACVQRGAVFALNWEMELPDPPLFGRPPFTHSVSDLGGGVGHDDELSGWNTQSSSQWDGFRHIRHGEHGFWAGVPDEEHGMHHWARRGIAGRAVLCDIGRWRVAAGRPLQYDATDPIEPGEITACLRDQGSEFEPGDVLLLRTGWVGWYRTLDQAARTRLADGAAFAAPGLRPSPEAGQELWDLHPAAVGADNPAVEAWPPMGRFLHFTLLPLLGLPLGEMWDLEALADDCAADGRYHCLFTSAPLNLHQGVASPPNALALK